MHSSPLSEGGQHMLCCCVSFHSSPTDSRISFFPLGRNRMQATPQASHYGHSRILLLLTYYRCPITRHGQPCTGGANAVVGSRRVQSTTIWDGNSSALSHRASVIETGRRQWLGIWTWTHNCYHSHVSRVSLVPYPDSAIRVAAFTIAHKAHRPQMTWSPACYITYKPLENWTGRC